MRPDWRRGDNTAQSMSKHLKNSWHVAYVGPSRCIKLPDFFSGVRSDVLALFWFMGRSIIHSGHLYRPPHTMKHGECVKVEKSLAL